MSYQQARHFNVPTRGVYVANPGYVFGAAGIPRGAVLMTINGRKTDTLRDFEAGGAQAAHGGGAPGGFLDLDEPHQSPPPAHPVGLPRVSPPALGRRHVSAPGG